MTHETTEPRPRRRAAQAAIAAAIVGAVLATGGIAHAGYRWGRMAPVTTPSTTTTAPPKTTTTVAPTVTAVAPTTTQQLSTINGYRWG